MFKTGEMSFFYYTDKKIKISFKNIKLIYQCILVDMFKAPPLFYIATCYRFYRQLPVPRFQQRQKQLHQLWRENPRRHPENFFQSRVCSTRPGVQSRRAVHVRQSIIFLIANYVFFR